MLKRLVPLLIFTLVGVGTAFAADGSISAHAKATPVCKAGQQSTKAKPCTVPTCKTGQKSTKAKPCTAAKAVAKTATKTTTTATATPAPTQSAGGTGAGGTPAGGGGNVGNGAVDAQCPAGTTIPLSPAGDGDTDNEGGFPTDDDGCL